MSELDPRFPPELEQEICLQTYFLCTTTKKPRSVHLMLVARRFHDWVAKHKYCTLQQLSHEHNIFEKLVPASSGKYYGPFVKHLMMGGAQDKDQLETLLRHCPNVVDLAIWSPHDTSLFVELLATESRSVRLRSISTNFSSLSEDDIVGPAFSKVSHLDVTNMGGKELARWTILTRLPELTHLIINEEVTPEVIRCLLKGCQHLQILVLARSPGYDLGTEIRDRRLVLLKISRYTIDDWMAFVNGTSEDIFSIAESISRAKSAGYKDCHTRWISSHRVKEDLMELGYHGNI
ncbi:hypothetical protein CPB83DRAFT_857112 [Crepidotus variabilis]|uniref:Uncharacterized protein n=1 Tax=Crepidotus variabilis TaxID=179855 RepID=A0A9P6JNP2_9AGAR|nr:hypothetical protein CPB83DRAFT_857112 [Crepidotus variabilis]